MVNIFSTSLLSLGQGWLPGGLALYTPFGSVFLPSPFAIVPSLSLLFLHPSSLLHFLIQWEMLPPAFSLSLLLLPVPGCLQTCALVPSYLRDCAEGRTSLAGATSSICVQSSDQAELKPVQGVLPVWGCLFFCSSNI